MRQRKLHCKESIPQKANRILNILLCIFALMALRIWHLSVVQYEERAEIARRPRERVVIEPAERASIYDRFGLPMAQNRVGYQATLIYAQLTEIPTARWVVGPDGKKRKTHPRREHITQLSNLLAAELELDPRRVEDEIHAKAALYYQRPYVLAEGITEEQYYRLRMLEREWTGLHARRVPVREYPNGRVGSHVVGYVGAIDRREYEAVAGEIKKLESYLEDWEAGEAVPLPKGMASNGEVIERLEELKGLAYTVRDNVGKDGVEARFEEDLRGFQGKRLFYSDARGNFLCELPGGVPPEPGKQLQLALSVELQEFAERLLIENESIREGRSSKRNRITGARSPLRQPWVKGGAVVAMEPHTGEVVALASYPRYDPNDFIRRSSESAPGALLRWLEADAYLAAIWDGKRPELREIEKEEEVVDQERWIDWETYLSTILPSEHPVRKQFKAHGTIEDAIRAQNLFSEALEEIGDPLFTAYDALNILFAENPHVVHQEKRPWGALEEYQERLSTGDEKLSSLQKQLQRYLGPLHHNYEKALFLDLCRLFVDASRFEESLIQQIGSLSIDRYRQLGWAFFSVQEALEEMMRDLFHEIDWNEWRAEEGSKWLKEQRAEEKAAGRYARPYLDLYDRKERSLFAQFWEEQRWTLLAAFLGKEETAEARLQPYLEFCAAWHEELISGAHGALPWVGRYHELNEALQPYETSVGIALLATMRRFEELERPLWGRYRSLRRENEGKSTERDLAAAFYPRYGYGSMRSLAYRHHCTQGSIFKVLTAYEALRQRFNAIEGAVSVTALNPFTMHDELFQGKQGWNVGRWANGEPIPRMYKGGRLPRSYSNLGKLDIIEALAHSANPYFAILAVDYLENPSDLSDAAKRFGYSRKTGIDLPGEVSGRVPNDLEQNVTGLYSMTMGQHSLVNTPLQTCVMLSAIANGGILLKPQIIHHPAEITGTVELPNLIQRCLLESMDRAVSHSRVARGGSLSYVYRKFPKRLQAFLELEGQFIGKTSTSEQLESVGLDLENGTNMYNHIWFGGISFPEKNTTSFLARDETGEPDLVVVVYLPFGGYGKEASPIAAEMVREWRNLKTKHQSKE